MANPASILDSIKKVLGIVSDDTAFDIDIIMHINTTFTVLQQLGVGPVTGFLIDDNTATWDTYISNPEMLAGVKSYISLKVRLLFDPPATSFGIEAVKNQIQELEWRLNVVGETLDPPVDPLSYTRRIDDPNCTFVFQYW